MASKNDISSDHPKPRQILIFLSKKDGEEDKTSLLPLNLRINQTIFADAMSWTALMIRYMMYRVKRKSAKELWEFGLKIQVWEWWYHEIHCRSLPRLHDSRLEDSDIASTRPPADSTWDLGWEDGVEWIFSCGICHWEIFAMLEGF